jgi:uncharacterized protein YbaP (TraB family)
MKTPRAAALFVLLAAAASGACRGNDSAANAAPTQKDPWGSTAQQDPLPHPLLWKIEKDGKTSYALGTFHMGVDPTTRLPDLVWQKLDAEPAFAMETDLSDPSLAKDIVERNDHKTLHDDLGDAYWRKLEAALTPDVAKRVNAMRPTIAATMLSMRGLPPTAPMDGVLLGHAQNQKKQIAYLEPAAVQVHALVRWMDARALEEMLDDLPYGDKMQKEMLSAYVAGDDQKILKISDAERVEWKKFGRSDAEFDEMMEEMLYHRNASWIDQIEKLHAGGGVFIAVGAMHLIGPKSVLTLLQAKGYKVTRLTP